MVIPSYLACRTVGHAGVPVLGQVEVGGAGTLVSFSRGEQAEVAAAPVVCLARVIEHCAHEGWERGKDVNPLGSIV